MSAEKKMPEPAFTRDQFTEAMHAAVAEKGRDYVFEDQCSYVDEATAEPLCLIGHVLIALGVAPSLLFACNQANATIVMKDILGITDDALILAANGAQVKQDCRDSWGAALDEYEATLAEVGEQS